MHQTPVTEILILFSSEKNAIECPTCHLPLKGTKELRKHVRLNPGCLWIKTSSPKEIEKELKKEVKRQKGRIYNNNDPVRKEKERKRAKQYYDDNKERERERKRKDESKRYGNNRQKEQERKRKDERIRYGNNQQKEQERKRKDESKRYKNNPQKKQYASNQVYKAQKEARDTAGDIQKFSDEGRYGPIFRN